MTSTAPRRGGLGLGPAAAEAIANVVTTPASLLIAVVSALATVGVLMFSVSETSALQHRFDDQVTRGRFVVVAVAGTPGGLDAARCEALGGVEGVVAAGSLLGSRSVRPAFLPLRPYQVVDATPGAVRAYFPAAAPQVTAVSGVLAGRDTARELGLVDGAELALSDREGDEDPDVLVVSKVLPPSSRSSELDRRLIAIRPAMGRTQACVVDLDPDHAGTAKDVVGAWFPAGDEAIVQPLPELPTAAPTPEEELARRLSNRGWAAAAGAVALVALSTWHGRRDEVALYRLLGASKRVILTMFVTETALLVVLPQAVGAAVVLALVRDDLITGAVIGSAAVDLARCVLVMAPLPLLAAGWHLFRSPFDTLKGR